MGCGVAVALVDVLGDGLGAALEVAADVGDALAPGGAEGEEPTILVVSPHETMSMHRARELKSARTFTA